MAPEDLRESYPHNRSVMAIRFRFAIILYFFTLFFLSVSKPIDAQSIGAYDLIGLINGMRNANGLGSLAVDSSLMACAQATAETMAASHMTWHIGNASGRASSFGYNNYNSCFATENFMMGGAGTTIAQIQASWSDATHMIPMQNPSYCHIGAGVASSNDGMYYFVVQAAYPAGVAGCSYSKSVGKTGNGAAGSALMIIKAVATATPDEDGNVFHKVEEGQTLWTISEAYNVTIKDIQSWNNLYDSTALSLGQMLYIPSTMEAGTTPTPHTELTVFPTADPQGKLFHEVKEGDTLWSISELWNVPLNSIYQTNNLNADSSIGLGWKIEIPVTPTMTPLPTDTPTVTPFPTETVPFETAMPEPFDMELSDKLESQKKESILHTPPATAKTYIYAGIAISTTIGASVIVIRKYLNKK